MPDLIYEKFDHYAILTMNRPERLNALGGDLRRLTTEAVADFEADPEMRAGILTGTGRAFSAGADLKEMNEQNQSRGGQRDTMGYNLADSMPFSRCRKPFIAAINGLCLAGGLERALDCDIRIASTAAYFGLFEVKRGIMPGYAIHHLARMLPIRRSAVHHAHGRPHRAARRAAHGSGARSARARQADAAGDRDRRDDRGQRAAGG